MILLRFGGISRAMELEAAPDTEAFRALVARVVLGVVVAYARADGTDRHSGSEEANTHPDKGQHGFTSGEEGRVS
jgi:hypothetical protein